MTIRNRPDYQIYNLPLTSAGTLDLPVIGSRVALIAAWSGAAIGSVSGGYQAVSGGSATVAQLSVQVGKTPGDPISMGVGTEVVCGNKFEFLRLSWPAQAGVIAVIVVSDDVDANGVHVTASPTIAAGAVSVVNGGNTLAVNASGAASVRLIGTTNQVSQLGGLTGTTLVTNPELNHLPLNPTTGAQIQLGSLGASSFAVQNAVAGSNTIVAPASNVSGVVLRTATISNNGAAGAYLCAGTSAPTTLVSNPAILAPYGSPPVVLPREILLPIGQGLYAFNGTANNFYAAGTYDIL